MASIPIHATQTTFLPQKISRQLDKLNCKFLWGDTANHRHCHTVSWETITTPKDAGGLGLACHMNLYDGGINPRASHIWKALLVGIRWLQQGMNWELGDG